jgi:hypothetical protein
VNDERNVEWTHPCLDKLACQRTITTTPDSAVRAATGHIAGARSIPIDGLASSIKQLPASQMVDDAGSCSGV